MGSTAGPLMKLLQRDLEPVLKIRLKDIISRGIIREVPAAVTSGVSGDVVPTLTSALVRVLTTVTSKRLTAVLTAGLTQVLVPSLTEAITRDPTGDYQCIYCEKAGVYCAGCASLLQTDSMQSSWAYARAAEASRTYVEMYAGVLGNYVAQDTLADVK